jgi:hypothetical protein
VEDASSELRLFLQGICCDYLLFHHLDEGVPPEAIRIRQEVALGDGVFADIEVARARRRRISSRSIRATPASVCFRASDESTEHPSPPRTAPRGSWWPPT